MKISSNKSKILADSIKPRPSTDRHRMNGKTLEKVDQFKLLYLHKPNTEHQQEKPTNCGTKAAEVLPVFLTGKLHNANQLNILVYLQLL